MSKTNWKDTPLLHKVVTVISVLASPIRRGIGGIADI